MASLFITYEDGPEIHHLDPTVQPSIEPGERPARPPHPRALDPRDPRAQVAHPALEPLPIYRPCEE
jgi:hypothetical protein